MRVAQRTVPRRRSRATGRQVDAAPSRAGGSQACRWRCDHIVEKRLFDARRRTVVPPPGYAFRLAERALDRLAVPIRLAVVGLLPPSPRASGIRLPPASPRLLRQPDVGALSSPLDWW